MKRSLALGLGTLLVALAAGPAQAQYNYPYPASYPNPYAYPPMAYPPMAYPPVQYPGYGYPGYPQMMPQQPMMMMPVPMSVTRVVPMQGPVETMPQGGPLSGEALATPGVQDSSVGRPLPNGAGPNAAPTIVPTAASGPRVSPAPVTPAADTASTTGEPKKKGLYRKLHDYLCGQQFQMPSK
jgi:hypothetical protein